VNWR